jgi:hypothetical protein
MIVHHGSEVISEFIADYCSIVQFIIKNKHVSGWSKSLWQEFIFSFCIK